MELRTLAHFAFHPDSAAVHFDEMLGDGETESGAAGFARARDIDAVEPLEDARLIGLGIPMPVSETVNTTSGPATLALTMICPPGSVY